MHPPQLHEWHERTLKLLTPAGPGQLHQTNALSTVSFPWSIAESLSVRGAGGSLAQALSHTPFKLGGVVQSLGGTSREEALERRRLRLGEYLGEALLRANAEPCNREPSLRRMLYRLLQYDLHVSLGRAPPSAAAPVADLS